MKKNWLMVCLTLQIVLPLQSHACSSQLVSAADTQLREIIGKYLTNQISKEEVFVARSIKAQYQACYFLAQGLGCAELIENLRLQFIQIEREANLGKRTYQEVRDSALLMSAAVDRCTEIVIN